MGKLPRSLYEHPLDPVEKGEYRVIIETPKGSRNKYTYDPASGLFLMSGVLAAGASFPYDFGFLPSTLGDDGDPLDVLVLMDEPVYPGIVLDVRIVGAIEAQQTEKNGDVVKNDRLVAVSIKSHLYGEVTELDDLAETLVDEIEHFFISYNVFKGKKFDPTSRCNAAEAHELVESAYRRFRDRPKKK
jgi:inorganic pyrophosphatase